MLYHGSLTMSQLTTMRISNSGDCSSESSSQAPILFTHNSITGCMFRWTEPTQLWLTFIIWCFLHEVAKLYLNVTLCCLDPNPGTVHSCSHRFTPSCRDLVFLMKSPWTQALSWTGQESSHRSVLRAQRYSWNRNLQYWLRRKSLYFHSRTWFCLSS